MQFSRASVPSAFTDGRGAPSAGEAVQCTADSVHPYPTLRSAAPVVERPLRRRQSDMDSDDGASPLGGTDD